MSLSALYASFIATMAFGILFNVPRKTLLSSGFTGMVSWVTYVFLTAELNVSIIIATMAAAFTVAIISQLLARIHQLPATIFSISGIIPLVPGGLAYDTVLRFIQDDYLEALKSASTTLLLAGSIAFGLIVSGVISEMFIREKPSRSL